MFHKYFSQNEISQGYLEYKFTHPSLTIQITNTATRVVDKIIF